jgi:hypothetical protein
MSTTTASVGKSQIAFRFRNDLVGVLKREAKKENRSLNNFIENFLVHSFSVDEEIPNATTIAAIEEAMSGKSTGYIDTSSMEAFIKSSLE